MSFDDVFKDNEAMSQVKMSKKRERSKPGHWEVSDTQEGRLQDWIAEWSKGCWDFIYTKPGPVLEKNFEKVTGGRKGLKILVPLSATTYDLIWLCEQGHTVVGADLAESAADRIFKQYKQTPIIEDVPSFGGKRYKNASGTFKYYVGDFFKFSEELEGKFDFIWDSKAMCAVDERDRSKYLNVIRSVMGPKCTLMVEFPKKNLQRAPYHFTKEELESYYGDLCDVEFVDESSFDLSVAFHGDIDDDGNPVPEEETETSEDKEKMVFVLNCYRLQKRE